MDFGDDNTHTEQTNNGSYNYNVNHEYLTNIDSTYQALLFVTSENGCISNSSIDIIVSASPVVDITVQDEELCFGNEFVFTDNSFINFGIINSCQWDFGDSNSQTITVNSTNCNYTISNNYLNNEDQIYTVGYNVTSSNGCISNSSIDVIVHAKPYVHFTVQDDDLCFGNEFTFIDTSFINTGNIDSTFWNFGNGIIDTLTYSNAQYINDTIRYSYTENISASYDVIFKVRSGYGCFSDDSLYTVNVETAPTVLFSSNADSLCWGNEFVFTDNSYNSGIINYCQWDFGDGATASQTINETSCNYNINHEYLINRDTTYTINISVVSINDCISKDSIDVIVHAKPYVHFTVQDDDLCFGNEFTFIDTSFINTGNIDSTFWNFGNGIIDTLTYSNAQYINDTIRYSYTENISASYDVIFKVRSGYGCFSDDSLYTVNVETAPTVLFSSNADSLCWGNEFVFTDNSYNSGIINYCQWDFGDGATASQTINETSCNYNINHEYLINRDTTYTINISVVSINDCISKDSIDVIVHAKPYVHFTVQNDDLCFGNDFVFTDSSYINTGEIEHCYWDFGDGTTASQSINETSCNYTINYNYTNNTTNIYTFSLYNISGFGCESDTLEQSITVKASPIVDITVHEDELCFDNEFVFTDNSYINSNEIDSCYWDFGDGNSQTINENSTNYNYTISHNYSNNIEQTYMIGYFARALNECITNSSIYVTVHEQPGSNFTEEENSLCFGNEFIFTDNSIINFGTIEESHWDFGNDSVQIEYPGVPQCDYSINYSYLHNLDSIYNVSLFTVSDFGCYSDTFSQLFEVREKPLADFSIVSLDEQCFEGNNFIFSDFSSINTGELQYGFWDFGDGFQTTVSNDTTVINYQIEHSYIENKDSTYVISLFVESEKICSSDIISKEIVVHASPEPFIKQRHNIDTLCSNQYDVEYFTEKYPEHKYFWSIIGGEFQGETENDSAIVHWNKFSEITKGFVILEEENIYCKYKDTLETIISPDTAPNRAKIVFKNNDKATSIFICLYFTANKYEWGIDSLGEQGSYHFFDIFPNSYDSTNTYWVITSLDYGQRRTCSTKSIYEGAVLENINKKTSLSEAVNIFPNPNNGKFSLKIDYEKTGTVLLKLISPTGNTQIKDLKFIKKDTVFLQEIDFSELNKGVYLLEIYLENEKCGVKFIIQ